MISRCSNSLCVWFLRISEKLKIVQDISVFFQLVRCCCNFVIQGAPPPRSRRGGKPESRSAHHNSGERSCSPPRRDVPGEGKGSGPLQSQLRGGQEGTCRAEGEGPQSLPSPPPSREAPSPQSPPQSRGASPSQSRGGAESKLYDATRTRDH